MSERLVGLSASAIRHLETMYGIKIKGTPVVSVEWLAKILQKNKWKLNHWAETELLKEAKKEASKNG